MWMSLLVVIAFFGLGWRLVDLQYLTADDTWKDFEAHSIVEQIEMPWRGEITDTDGNTLAASVRHYNIGADPQFNGFLYPEVARVLSPILRIPQDQLAERIRPRDYKDKKTGKLRPVKFVGIANAISHDTLEKIDEALKSIGSDWDLTTLSKGERQVLNNVRNRGVYVSREVQTRHYPNGNMGGAFLGLVNSREHKSPEASGPDYFVQYGANGIEAVLDSQLAGTPGRVTKVRTELVEQVTDRFPAKDGANVALTIVRRIQEGADKAAREAWVSTGAKSVFITVMDVSTGEILALSSVPSFDPSDRTTFKEEYSRLLPLTEMFEPGSIIKAIAIAGALEEKAVTLDTSIYCEKGYWSEPAIPLTDTHHYENLSVKEIVTKSSNIGTAKIAALLGNDRFYQYMQAFGVGSKTGVGLYEESGILRARETYVPLDFTRLPIGYACSVTQLQMACIYSAIANGGVMMRPHILRRIEERNGEVIIDFKPQAVRRIISGQTSREMMEALQTVTEKGGTATTAALDYYTVAGKTGTARKYTGNPKIPYDKNHYNASFVGVFPASAPRICIAVTVSEPDKHKVGGYYGGLVAGPIFAKLAMLTGQHLNIKPDKAPDSTNQVASVGP